MTGELEGTLAAWPALRGEAPFTAEAPMPMKVERAVFGKVHGASSDFRWIAASSTAHLDGLELRVSPGLVHESKRACAWRVDGAHVHAVSLQPSRARDSRGRPGLIDLQVLTWAPPQSGASFQTLRAAWLLEQCASLDAESTWWSQRQDPAWTRPSFMLGPSQSPILVPEQTPTLQELCAAMQRGLGALRMQVATLGGREALIRCYAALFARRLDETIEQASPALLHGLDKPLPPAALAALLLPLPPCLANRISLLGWVLAARNRPASLAGNWDVVMCGDNPGLAELAHEPLSTPLLDLALQVVDALDRDDPGGVPDLTRALDLDLVTGRKRGGSGLADAQRPASLPIRPEPETSNAPLFSDAERAHLVAQVQDAQGHHLLQGLPEQAFSDQLAEIDSFNLLRPLLRDPQTRALLLRIPRWDAIVGRIFAREKQTLGPMSLPDAARSYLRLTNFARTDVLPASWLDALLDEGVSLENLTLGEEQLAVMLEMHADRALWARRFLGVRCKPDHIRTILADVLPWSVRQTLAFAADWQATKLNPGDLFESGRSYLLAPTDPAEVEVTRGLVQTAWRALRSASLKEVVLEQRRDCLRAAAVVLIPGKETAESIALKEGERAVLHPLWFVPALSPEGRPAFAREWPEQLLRSLFHEPGQHSRNPHTGAPWPSDDEQSQLLSIAREAEREGFVAGAAPIVAGLTEVATGFVEPESGSDDGTSGPGDEGEDPGPVGRETLVAEEARDPEPITFERAIEEAKGTLEQLLQVQRDAVARGVSHAELPAVGAQWLAQQSLDRHTEDILRLVKNALLLGLSVGERRGGPAVELG